MRKKQETLIWLEKAYGERNGRMANVGVHPEFAFLHGDKGFESLLVRMGVPKKQGVKGSSPTAANTAARE